MFVLVSCLTLKALCLTLSDTLTAHWSGTHQVMGVEAN